GHLGWELNNNVFGYQLDQIPQHKQAWRGLDVSIQHVSIHGEPVRGVWRRRGVPRQEAAGGWQDGDIAPPLARKVGGESKSDAVVERFRRILSAVIRIRDIMHVDCR